MESQTFVAFVVIIIMVSISSVFVGIQERRLDSRMKELNFMEFSDNKWNVKDSINFTNNSYKYLKYGTLK